MKLNSLEGSDLQSEPIFNDFEMVCFHYYVKNPVSLCLDRLYRQSGHLRVMNMTNVGVQIANLNPIEVSSLNAGGQYCASL